MKRTFTLNSYKEGILEAIKIHEFDAGTTLFISTLKGFNNIETPLATAGHLKEKGPFLSEDTAKWAADSIIKQIGRALEFVSCKEIVFEIEEFQKELSREEIEILYEDIHNR